MLLLTKRPQLRSLLICILLLLSVGCYLFLTTVEPPTDTSTITPLLLIWISAFLPYLAACALVLTTRVETSQKRWQLIEMAIILFGALLLRAMLLPQNPDLSRDSWRYVWDARVILHGYSPYTNAPGSPLLKHLQDTLIYGNSRFRNVPTAYPPVAEYVYTLGYLIAPSNLFVLKLLFVLMDVMSCGIIALMLVRRGLDPRRTILYAWCPLPVVEFAINGHVDALTVMLIALVLFVATSPHAGKRSMRILLGFLVALATLTKFYPILLLVVVIRRRDIALLVSCFATILLAYLPFLILGHGQILGFITTYAGEQGQNEGIVPIIVQWLFATRLHFSGSIVLLVEHIVDVLLAVGVSAVVFIQRQRERMSIEMGMLVLTGVVYAVAPHIFPWYTTALLFFVPLLVRPLWQRLNRGVLQWSGPGIAVAAVWYFVCTTLFGYFYRNAGDWTMYYIVAYWPVVLVLSIAGVLVLYTHRQWLIKAE